MMKPRVWISLIIVVAVWVSACKREPPVKVLNMMRVRGVALDPAQPASMADDGMVFMVLDLDAGVDLGSEPAMETAMNASLIDKQGRAYTGPGVEYKRETNANRITLFWSVPEDERAFTLAYGDQRLDLDPSQIVEGQNPPPQESPTVGSQPEGTRGVPGGVTGGIPPAAGENRGEPPPPPTPDKVPKVPGIVSGGVLNGKATSLPQPPYPAIAKAAKVSGTVAVQVTVDESGKVISAAAVSGHPLLRQAAAQAARQARFLPTKLSGTPVKVSGVIVYNFAIP